MSPSLRIASVNVNGIRAAFRNGMRDWLAGSGVDILALQEVRAETQHITDLLGDEWAVLHDPAAAKGRAGVAIASRRAAEIHRVTFGAEDFDSAGRWLEADYDVDGTLVTVVSAYVHAGAPGTPKQDEKHRFLAALEDRLPRLAEHTPLAAVVGDLNVGHRTLDIRNWKGNLKNAGFLPEERATFDRILGHPDTPGYNAGGGLGWVDVGRRSSGEVDGPYTWWSVRGRAFDNDAGWRIDYQLASPELASTIVGYRVDRAPSHGERWSDHAPVVVDYAI